MKIKLGSLKDVKDALFGKQIRAITTADNTLATLKADLNASIVKVQHILAVCEANGNKPEVIYREAMDLQFILQNLSRQNYKNMI